MRFRCVLFWSAVLLIGLVLSGAAASPLRHGARSGAAFDPREDAGARSYSEDRAGLRAHRSGSSSRSTPGIRDTDGRTLRPFDPAGTAGIVFFLTSDCPISNGYAQEIQRVCREYGARGVGCSLMYEDLEIGGSASGLDGDVRRNVREYGYAGIPAAVDRDRVIANHAKASVTPTAVVVDEAGAIRYRGRIDNFYAALGRPRQQVTERDLRDALDAVLAGRPVPRPETQAVGCFIVDPALLRR
jgi:hypothetical protein